VEGWHCFFIAFYKIANGFVCQIKTGKGIRSLRSQAGETGKGIRSLRSQVKVKKINFSTFTSTSTSTFTFTFDFAFTCFLTFTRIIGYYAPL
jgi:hypothetical protein